MSGADPVTERKGFKDMLERITSNGVRCIIIESPDRFARDLAVQLAGHDFLKGLGVSLIPATAPNHFTEDTPTARLVRQVLGAISEFDKATLVAKLKAAGDRKAALTGERCGGQASHKERRPEVVALALQQGQWLPWLKSCDIEERTAQRYMRLARNRAVVEAKSDTVSDLGVRGALRERLQLARVLVVS